MRIVYLANIRLPTEKAHGLQIMKMCEAFALAGAEVELVVPTRHTDITEEPFTYYGVAKQFLISSVSAPDTVSWGRLGFLFQSFMFARRAAKLLKELKPDLVYGRDELVLWKALTYGAPVVWESHTGARNYFARQVAKRARGVVAITGGLKSFYVERGVSAKKVLVAHDGVDLEAFANPEAQVDARTRLGLPLNKKVALYIGRLDGWKGSETLFEAAALMPVGVVVAAIGGEEAQVEVLKKKYPRVMFLGFRPYRELSNNQAAADVLVLPNTAKNDISARFTSPLKLFTYMASGRPIVASNLPSLREVIDETTSFLVEPDSPKALAGGVVEALGERGPERAAAAKAKVATYSWKDRARRILNAYGSNL